MSLIAKKNLSEFMDNIKYASVTIIEKNDHYEVTTFLKELRKNGNQKVNTIKVKDLNLDLESFAKFKVEVSNSFTIHTSSTRGCNVTCSYTERDSNGSIFGDHFYVNLYLKSDDISTIQQRKVGK